MFPRLSGQRHGAVELPEAFTSEETARILALREQYQTYSDQFKLDINYRQLEFARWLAACGRLDEWQGARAEVEGEPQSAHSRRRQKHALYQS